MSSEHDTYGSYRPAVRVGGGRGCWGRGLAGGRSAEHSMWKIVERALV